MWPTQTSLFCLFPTFPLRRLQVSVQRGTRRLGSLPAPPAGRTLSIDTLVPAGLGHISANMWHLFVVVFLWKSAAYSEFPDWPWLAPTCVSWVYLMCVLYVLCFDSWRLPVTLPGSAEQNMPRPTACCINSARSDEGEETERLIKSDAGAWDESGQLVTIATVVALPTVEDPFYSWTPWRYWWKSAC